MNKPKISTPKGWMELPICPILKKGDYFLFGNLWFAISPDGAGEVGHRHVRYIRRQPRALAARTKGKS